MNIYNRNGAIVASVDVGDSCEWRKELMVEEYVSLKFTLAEHVQFRKGFYIAPSFGTHRYEIVNLDRPRFNTANGGWDYDIKFHAEWERWKQLVLFYDRQSGNHEKSWSLTQTPGYFMDIVLSNLRRLGLGNNWQADIDPSLTEVKNLTFDATTIFDALTNIAQAWDTEWWIEGRTIHLSKCEYGTPVVLEIGGLINTMEAAASGGTYATRLYAFGSTRNLPTNYRGSQSGALVEGVVEKRLQLPEGTACVDAWENLADEDVVEAVALFEDIYPRQVRQITAVTTKQYTDEIENEDGTTTREQWNAYRIEDDGFAFSEDYRLPDQELRIVFQAGSRLAGLDFAVNFIAAGQDGNANPCFEIIRNSDYGVPLPNDTLKPREDDPYILYGFDTSYVSDTYVPAAEQELLEAAKTKIAEMVKDDDTYTCKTDPVRCSGYTQDEYGDLVFSNADVADLDVGQAVSLKNPVYFGEEQRPSRIRAFTKKLTDIYNCSYEVGYSARYSIIGSLQGEVKTITYGSNTYIATGSGAGSTITLIRQYDTTEATDNNAYSAKRADREFLHSSKADTASEKIVFNKGIEAGSFSRGSTGAAFYRDASGNWVVESDFFRVRKKLTAEEVEIMKTSHIGGRLMQTPASMTISEREVTSTFYRCYFNKEDSDGNAIVNSFATNDLAYCETFNLASNAYHTGNHFLWRKVIATGYDSAKGKYYIDLSKEDCLAGSDEPLQGDRIVTLGNTTDTTRQNAIIQAGAGSESPFYRLYRGINTYRLPSPVVQISPEGSWITVTDTSGDSVRITDLIDSLKDEMDSIRSQNDTQIELWFGDVTPTASNEPASTWLTADDKQEHLKDIYYHRGAGLAYSWEETQSGYEWVLLTDRDVLRALEKASQAQDTADGKRRVFVARPTQAQAYDVGDLWVNATFPTKPGEVTGDAQGNEHTYLNPLYNNDILRCVTAKTAGTAFQIDHWQPVQRYFSSAIEQMGNTISLSVTNLITNLEAAGVHIDGADSLIRIIAEKTQFLNPEGVQVASFTEDGLQANKVQCLDGDGNKRIEVDVNGVRMYYPLESGQTEPQVMKEEIFTFDASGNVDGTETRYYNKNGTIKWRLDRAGTLSSAELQEYWTTEAAYIVSAANMQQIFTAAKNNKHLTYDFTQTTARITTGSVSRFTSIQGSHESYNGLTAEGVIGNSTAPSSSIAWLTGWLMVPLTAMYEGKEDDTKLGIYSRHFVYYNGGSPDAALLTWNDTPYLVSELTIEFNKDTAQVTAVVYEATTPQH